MRGLFSPLAQSEIAVGAMSALVWSIGYVLSQVAQSEPANLGISVTGLVTQFGGLGLAIWLVILHTTRTIPKMQEDHRAERTEMIKAFQDRCDKQETCFRESLDKIVSGNQRGH